MVNYNVLNVSKVSLQYSCKDASGLMEKGFAKMNFETEFLQNEKVEDISKVIIDFLLLLDTQKIDEDNVSKTEVDAFFEASYVVMIQSDEIENMFEKDILHFIEPYIRKDVFDFCNEVGLPNIDVPYRFWKNDKAR